MHHPRLLLALLALVALIAAGCGSGDSTGADDPEPTPTAVPAAPTATPEPPPPDDDDDDSDDEADEAPADDAGEGEDDAGQGEDDATNGEDGGEPPTDDAAPEPPTVLAAVFSSGGFVPVEVALGSFPQLVIMSDGVVYRPGAQVAVFPPPLTPSVERLQLEPEAVAAIADLLATSPVVRPDVDFGSPSITDVTTTTLTAYVDGTEITVAAYALGLDDAVGGAPQDARAELSSLLADIDAIVDAAADTGEIVTPPTVAVLTFPGLAIEENAAVRPWPIDALPAPEPGGADCVLVTGDELDTLWAAAADATTQTAWRIDGQTKAVVLRPVFDHETICR